MGVCVYGCHFRQTGYQPCGCGFQSWWLWSDGQEKWNQCFPCCPSKRLRNWSHEVVSAIPSHISPLILHTRGESGAYLRDSTLYFSFPLYLFVSIKTIMPQTLILSGHTIVHRRLSPPRTRRYRNRIIFGSADNGHLVILIYSHLF